MTDRSRGGHCGSVRTAISGATHSAGLVPGRRFVRNLCATTVDLPALPASVADPASAESFAWNAIAAGVEIERLLGGASGVKEAKASSNLPRLFVRRLAACRSSRTTGAGQATDALSHGLCDRATPRLRPRRCSADQAFTPGAQHPPGESIVDINEPVPTARMRRDRHPVGAGALGTAAFGRPRFADRGWWPGRISMHAIIVLLNEMRTNRGTPGR